MEQTPTGPRARQCEERRIATVVDAVAPMLGRALAEHLAALVEDDRLHDPYLQREEGTGGKLARMRESAAGRRWLQEHPEATWDEIADAPL